jgi:hypothetical protein
MTTSEYLDSVIDQIERGLLDDTTPTNDVEYLMGV